MVQLFPMVGPRPRLVPQRVSFVIHIRAQGMDRYETKSVSDCGIFDDLERTGLNQERYSYSLVRIS